MLGDAEVRVFQTTAFAMPSMSTEQSLMTSESIALFAPLTRS